MQDKESDDAPSIPNDNGYIYQIEEKMEQIMKESLEAMSINEDYDPN